MIDTCLPPAFALLALSTAVPAGPVALAGRCAGKIVNKIQKLVM
jgi:hypothetical protein